MNVRFANTTLEGDRSHLRLLAPGGALMLELKGDEIEAAIRGGFLDPERLHFSMFEYARMRTELAGSPGAHGRDAAIDDGASWIAFSTRST
jgi:hypothetical protein